MWRSKTQPRSVAWERLPRTMNISKGWNCVSVPEGKNTAPPSHLPMRDLQQKREEENSWDDAWDSIYLVSWHASKAPRGQGNQYTSQICKHILPKTMSWHALNISMDRDFTISPGNLNLLYFNLCSLSLVLLLGNTEKEPCAKHVLLAGLRFPFILRAQYHPSEVLISLSCFQSWGTSARYSVRNMQPPF